MLKKFEFHDDATIQVITAPKNNGGASDAGQQLKANVLRTLDVAELKRLSRDINAALAEDATNEALAVIRDFPVIDALWWFIENITDDSPARSACFFELRKMMRTPDSTFA